MHNANHTMLKQTRQPLFPKKSVHNLIYSAHKQKQHQHVSRNNYATVSYFRSQYHLNLQRMTYLPIIGLYQKHLVHSIKIAVFTPYMVTIINVRIGNRISNDQCEMAKITKFIFTKNKQRLTHFW